MTRFGTKLAIAVLAWAPLTATGVAPAQGDSAVDEDTGPVAYANGAAIQVGGEGGGNVITETQRSPLEPGESTLSQERSVVPADDEEKNAVGPHYALHLGQFGEQSPYPDGVDSVGHRVQATLADNHVPSAVAEANYALQDNGRGGDRPVDNTVVAFNKAKSTVDCSATDQTSAETTAETVWVRGEDNELSEVELPDGQDTLELTGLPFGPPTDVEGADRDNATSDVLLSRVDSYDQLLRQDMWRAGDVTTAAGWQVEIVSHVRDAEGKDLQDVRTKLVLGGMSCSLPRDFVPATPGNPPGGGQQPAPSDPDVPVKVPAGVTTAPASTDDTTDVLGFGLVGSGVALAAAAGMVAWRRRSTTASSRTVATDEAPSGG